MNNQTKVEEIGKQKAAEYSIQYIEKGMKLGLGTGTTVNFLVEIIAKKNLQKELGLTLVSTSTRTTRFAEKLGLQFSTLEEVKQLDLTLDGADEFDSEKNLIKGGGGALLQEKIVASSSTTMRVIAGLEKKVELLGKFPLPIEVVAFGWNTTQKRLVELFTEMYFEEFNCDLRMAGSQPLLTDESNYILDFTLNRISAPQLLEEEINKQVGVVECGIFSGLCSEVIVGDTKGKISKY